MESRVVEIHEKAGSYEARLLEFEAIREETLRREMEKRRAECIERAIQKIPMRFRNKSFHDYVVENPGQIRIKNLARRYVDTFKERLIDGSCLILNGKPGTGKTLLSLLIYQELAKKGFNVRYESSLEFISELLNLKFKSETVYQNYINAFENIHFLIIDEVTESVNKGGMPSETEKQALFQIINKRYEKNLCTLVITNRNHEELVNRLGVPMVDRLSEKGISMAFDWNSYRQR